MKKIAIIGAGPGGYVAAIRGAQLGAEIHLIERERVGGTCLNRGCIPTKTYFSTAKTMEAIRNGESVGIVGAQGRVDGEALWQHKEDVVGQLVGGIEQILNSYPNIHYYQGTARLISKEEVRIGLEGGEERLEVDAIVIATGAKPQMTETQGVDLPGVLTSDDILELKEIPNRLVVVGAGVIGLEFASIYQGLGSQVTLLASRILKDGDKEIGRRLVPLLKKQGVRVYNDIRAQRIEKVEDGLKVTARYKTKDEEEVVEADYVLIASGRNALVDGLGLEEVGVATSDKGFIQVDEGFKTNVEGIYAIGDVTGKSQLAHVASAQGIYLMEVLMGRESKLDVDSYPACTFTLTEVAQVGATEEALKKAGVDYQVAKTSWMANGKALSMNESDGLIKMLASPEGVLLGCHILGPHASDLIHEAALLISQGGHLEELGSTIHAHPTLSEAIQETAQSVFGEAIHVVKKRERRRKSRRS